MANTKLYAPARPGLLIPMPDRDNRPIPAEGIAADLAKLYYRRLFDDGDIVEVKPTTDRPAAKRAALNRK
ncbi:Protein of unknown function [Mesorhizobium albiziae]|uniref:DUF2635 domain-containing protein n=1 Tax=Neomesorhizobium albiziae TaxID=335020 RepID=A0A1I3YC53_9HYPH|nr:DUF2635 domain-containing protein [Mesorhizobium albiziae]GLS29955.1 hypothetical protein GCM10007937_16630 [Mesorhizobium albiziae]SFK29448.1 Protein of unknown function [Mesorhizobium albiziae]